MQTPIYYSILLQQKVWARAYVNELPIYKGAYLGPDSRSGPLNYYLVPGKNKVTVELLTVPKPHNSEHLEAAFVLELYRVLNPNPKDPTDPVEREKFVFVRYPEVLDTAPEQRHRRMPFYFETEFDPGIDVPLPPFLAAPLADFGCEGTADLHLAVERVWEAVSSGASAFIDEIGLKLTHGEKAMEGHDWASAREKERSFREDLFPYDPTPEPLDLSELHFRPLLGGRVAHVTRRDGGYALVAPCAKDRERRICTDLFFTQHQGRWRVFV